MLNQKKNPPKNSAEFTLTFSGPLLFANTRFFRAGRPKNMTSKTALSKEYSCFFYF